MIHNHYSAKLSNLDMQMVQSIPPGGNWKDIPLHIPSKRLDQIRESYKAGKGSRSTYYGRMLPGNPSHTISTYFNRPGNGAFIHYSQDRVISQREAARIQSFPDSFVFSGSKTAINKQIGNAVPPVMAYQIAKSIGEEGNFVDLFCGAGGFSKGFEWAGWNHLVANDIEKNFLETYANNISSSVIHGDITSIEIQNDIIDQSNVLRRKKDNGPFVVVGGPPCQGFSTAGKKRSMDDGRNHLYKEYARLIGKMKPDLFLFENVLGIRSMENGNVLKMVRETLEDVGYSTIVWELQSEYYGVPQRRSRIMIVGVRDNYFELSPPEKVTFFSRKPSLSSNLPDAVSISEAIDDLPPLLAGEDGEDSVYSMDSRTVFQQLMRDELSVGEYLEWLKLQGKAK